MIKNLLLKLFNYILNELWLNNKFDEYQNYPNDFSTDYIYSILIDKVGVEFADNWKKWSEGFIEMHTES